MPEKVSTQNRNDCPTFSGIGVQFKSESVSSVVRILHVPAADRGTVSIWRLNTRPNGVFKVSIKISPQVNSIRLLISHFEALTTSRVASLPDQGPYLSGVSETRPSLSTFQAARESPSRSTRGSVSLQPMQDNW